MKIFLSSFIFMFIAEFGDKTQLLVLSFATRTKPLDIIWAVIISTLLSHILAVSVGRVVAITLPDIYLQVTTSVFFISFGIYELFNAFAKSTNISTVTGHSLYSMIIAFLIAEIGDKSQLATITLSIKYNMPFIILISTTLGIVTADIVAIYLGSILGKKINKKTVRLLSCAIFLTFGIYNLFLIF
ncbi:MAG: TMEM165/GDT1 family protein [Endomicrobium sp.]|nr:TMEM165/GDT1 family protein [Endomicrobium sp.]